MLNIPSPFEGCLSRGGCCSFSASAWALGNTNVIRSLDDRGETPAAALTKPLWLMYWEWNQAAAGHAIAPHLPGRAEARMGNNHDWKECKDQPGVPSLSLSFKVVPPRFKAHVWNPNKTRTLAALPRWAAQIFNLKIRWISFICAIWGASKGEKNRWDFSY